MVKRSIAIKLGLSMLVVGMLLAGCAPPATPTVAPPVTEVVTDLGGQEITIAVENAYPPFNLIGEETGEATGWDYDVWRAICAKLNCTAVFKEAAWEGLFEAMAAGEYDVAADGITITLERSKKIDYSDPYMEYGQVLLVRVDEEEITSGDTLVALTDKTVGVQIGTTNEITAISLVGEERVKSFDTYDLPVAALIAGDVNAVVIDEVAAVGFMMTNPGKLKIAPEPLTGGELLGFVFPPKSSLVTPTNWALQELFADGTMDELYNKWFRPE